LNRKHHQTVHRHGKKKSMSFTRRGRTPNGLLQLVKVHFNSGGTWILKMKFTGAMIRNDAISHVSSHMNLWRPVNQKIKAKMNSIRITQITSGSSNPVLLRKEQ